MSHPSGIIDRHTGDGMDFSIKHGWTNGEERIFFDMDHDTAWAFALRMGEALGVSKIELAEVYEEIYGRAQV
jgi:hypothetical protein